VGVLTCESMLPMCGFIPTYCKVLGHSNNPTKATNFPISGYPLLDYQVGGAKCMKNEHSQCICLAEAIFKNTPMQTFSLLSMLIRFYVRHKGRC
jgi:hypothetical protein